MGGEGREDGKGCGKGGNVDCKGDRDGEGGEGVDGENGGSSSMLHSRQLQFESASEGGDGLAAGGGDGGEMGGEGEKGGSAPSNCGTDGGASTTKKLCASSPSSSHNSCESSHSRP